MNIDITKNSDMTSLRNWGEVSECVHACLYMCEYVCTCVCKGEW